MNNLYNWHDEQMVKHEMLEVNRAVEQARLLKDAGISQQSWLVRSVLAVRNLLNTRRKVSKEHHSLEHQSY